MFDRIKKYYKIFNEKDNHHGFQYKDGLNIDCIPFNDDPKKSCCEGGLYFSDAEHICGFLGMGDYIREVDIPDNAKVVKDSDGNKWRADSLFLYERKDLRLVETWEWMIDQGIDIHSYNNYVLRWAAYDGHLDVTKFIVEKGANIHNDDDYALRCASSNGHLDVVKFLVENGANIHADYDYALNWVNINSHKEIFDYLKEKTEENN